MRNKVMASPQAKQLSEREVEEQYGINARTLQGWRTRKKGPPYLKVGGTLVRYNRIELEAVGGTLVRYNRIELEAWITSSPHFLSGKDAKARGRRKAA